MHIGDLPGKLYVKKRAKDRAKANTGKPTKTKALQVAEPPPIRPEVLTGEGDVGERVATLGRCFADGVMHHYHLSTGHMAQMPRSDVRPETLAALRPIIKVATSGHVVPLPGFTEYFLSIRNTWIGAVGWLIEETERRVMVRCVTAWTVRGRSEGRALVGGGATGGAGLALLSGQAWSTTA